MSDLDVRLTMVRKGPGSTLQCELRNPSPSESLLDLRIAFHLFVPGLDNPRVPYFSKKLAELAMGGREQFKVTPGGFFEGRLMNLGLCSQEFGPGETGYDPAINEFKLTGEIRYRSGPGGSLAESLDRSWLLQAVKRPMTSDPSRRIVERWEVVELPGS